MGDLIASLWEFIKTSLIVLGKFLLVVLLGVVALLIFLLPWIIRIGSVVAWFAGAYIAGETLTQLYGPITDELPLMMLWVIPAILAAVVPVWMHYLGMLPWVWGGFFLYGMLGFGFRRAVQWLLINWPDADLFFRVAPVLFLTAMVLYISIRLKLIMMRKGVVSLN